MRLSPCRAESPKGSHGKGCWRLVAKTSLEDRNDLCQGISFSNYADLGGWPPGRVRTVGDK
jgi:hypothetical protein